MLSFRARLNLSLLCMAVALSLDPAEAGATTSAPAIVVKFRAIDSDASGPSPDAIGVQLAALSRAVGVDLRDAGLQRGGGQLLELPPGFDGRQLGDILTILREDPNLLYADPVIDEVVPSKAGTQISRVAAEAARARALIVRLRGTPERPSRDVPARLDETSLTALSRHIGVTLGYARGINGGFHVLELPEPVLFSQAQDFATRLESHPLVESADVDGPLQGILVPNDTYYSYQWHYFEEPGGIHLPAAWDVTTGAPGVRVAVLDSGIRFDHPDLSTRTVGGYDFISNSFVANDGDGRDVSPLDPGDGNLSGDCGTESAPRNSSWHGTHVAGTIGARANDGYGVAGVNWISPIVPIRVLGRCGGAVSDVVDAVRWASGGLVSGVPANSSPARVLNLSLGSGVSSPCPVSFQSAIDEALSRGAVIVVAAGNSAGNAADYPPANCNGVIVVHATTRDGDDAAYSNYGPTVDISAPGGRTAVTYPGPLGTQPYDGVLSDLNSGALGPVDSVVGWYQGTSMAAPHVSGVASLILSKNPSWTPAQVLNRIQLTASPFPVGGFCHNTGGCGAGIVNAAQAVATSRGDPTCTPSDTTLCAQNGRFRVRVTWRDLSGVGGNARVASVLPNSGIFYFYGPDNAEMLVKVLNGCGDPTFSAYWVYAAAATNFSFTIKVEDIKSGLERNYSNPTGHIAETIADVSAFETCP